MYVSERTQRLQKLTKYWAAQARKNTANPILAEYAVDLAGQLEASRADDTALATGVPVSERPLGVMRLGGTAERVELRNRALALARLRMSSGLTPSNTI
jgi:hypothetical protein